MRSQELFAMVPSYFKIKILTERSPYRARYPHMCMIKNYLFEFIYGMSIFKIMKTNGRLISKLFVHRHCC